MAGLAVLLAAGSGAGAASRKDDDVVVINHAEGRRSKRIVWLCEELGIPYELKFVRGDLVASMEALKQENPVMPMFPNITYRGQRIVESGAIIELLLARYGKGRLVPPVESQDYAYYLQFLHYAEGTAMARITMDLAMKVPMIQHFKPGMRQGAIGSEAVFYFMEQWLGEHPYFGGKQFTAADIMMQFPALAGILLGLKDEDFPNIVAWRKRVESRPAYIRANAVAEPDGCQDPKLFIPTCRKD
jgi:glutathione S-transferase